MTAPAAEVNCIFTKVLIPYLEREVGPEGGAAICRAAGRSREYLMADHNWIPLALANDLMRLGQELMGERDLDAWQQRLWEFSMDWKPREERSYLGTYSMGIGDPRTVYARQEIFHTQCHRWATLELMELGRTHAIYRRTPLPGFTAPRWTCLWLQTVLERFPTNWGLPRATLTERQCAAEGAEACVMEVRWRNPSLGRAFWAATAVGAVASAGLAIDLAIGAGMSGQVTAITATLPTVAGVALGYALRERGRRHHTQRLMDLQSEEILYSNNELEKKFRDLEDTIERLSLLIDLSAAVNATLDPEKIYEQAVERLVNPMGYESVYLFVADAGQRNLRTHKVAGGAVARRVGAAGLTLPMTVDASAAGKAAVTGLTVVVNDLAGSTEPVDRKTADMLGIRALVAVPLRAKTHVFGALVIHSSVAGRFSDGDVELISAVANHVSLAVDRAESFQMIEELTRGLEDKVRVRSAPSLMPRIIESRYLSA